MSSAAHRTKQYFLLLKRGEGLQADAPDLSVSQLPMPLPPVPPGGSADHAVTMTNTGRVGGLTLYRCGAVLHGGRNRRSHTVAVPKVKQQGRRAALCCRACSHTRIPHLARTYRFIHT